MAYLMFGEPIIGCGMKAILLNGAEIAVHNVTVLTTQGDLDESPGSYRARTYTIPGTGNKGLAASFYPIIG